ncbi:MAG: SUMF1/EgtB/PvdO family nonheme iron enzyme, partial [Nitrospinae bacterium]|nr:SUMF1/EgtB/PvdO family nonheme iron enzyme [Nitrospinota bacterium]
MTLFCAGAAAAENRGAQVRIPAGEFQMGTTAGTARERPVHKVWVDAFVIDRHEISNKAYETWQPGHRRSHMSACDECPVTLVTWHQAQAFCRHQGGRLPTEAEWEKAARGPNGFAYGFGNHPDGSKANFGKGLHNGAVPVNSFSPNGYGLQQMNGNVWEWVGDWFGP